MKHYHGSPARQPANILHSVLIFMLLWQINIVVVVGLPGKTRDFDCPTAFSANHRWSFKVIEKFFLQKRLIQRGFWSFIFKMF